MNLRQFSMAILISTLPIPAQAAARLSLNRGDFLFSERAKGEDLRQLTVKLSKSGKAKLRKLNKD